jgi:hypothetical protein
MTGKKDKEIDLVNSFCEWLEKKGLEFKRELRKGSYHNDGYVDVVIKDDYQPHPPRVLLTAVEAKMNDFRSVMSQATTNTLWFARSFILYPRLPRKSVLEKYKDESRQLWGNIGLIIPDGDGFKVVIKVHPLVFPFTKKQSYSFKTQRNWFENRAGRVLSKKECSDDDKKREIEPDYLWTKNRSFKERCIGCGRVGLVIFFNDEERWCYSCDKKWKVTVDALDQ